MRPSSFRVYVFTATVIGGLLLVGPAPAQTREERQEERRQAQATQAQQRMYERIQEAIGCSDDEWQVLQPRVDQVLALQAEVSSANTGIAALTGRRGRPTVLGGNVDAASKVVQAAQYLERALSDPSTNPDQIRTALEVAREARAEAILKLRAARKELIQYLTVRQESVLFQMGLVE
jgi:hypothetical protein